MFKKVFAGMAVLVALGTAAPASAYQVFVKIDGIEGDSTNGKYARQIEAVAFSWNVQQPESSTASSTGTFTGTRAIISPFAITKLMDRSSVKLAVAAAAGDHFPSAVITILDNRGFPAAVFKLSNVMIGSVSQAGAASPDPFMEEVTMRFTKIEWLYYVYDSTGKPTGNISGGWDLAMNKKV